MCDCLMPQSYVHYSYIVYYGEIIFQGAVDPILTLSYKVYYIELL